MVNFIYKLFRDSYPGFGPTLTTEKWFIRKIGK